MEYIDLEIPTIWKNYLFKFQNCQVQDFPINTDRFLVTVETRCHELLEVVIKNFLYFLQNKNWGLVIFHGNTNKDYLIEITKNWKNVILHNLEIDKLVESGYNNLLCSLDFWNKIPGENVLIFQTDTLLLKDNIAEFMTYDYVGAPWDPALPFVRNISNCVGNGGLSFRKKSAMISCIRNHAYRGENEDIFFSTYINNKPLLEKAAEFSVETYYYNEFLTPMGLHKTYVHKGLGIIKRWINSIEINTIPIVIIAYNNLTFVKSFVEQCRRLTNKIIILDNNSEYEKQLQYYDNLKDVEVRRLKQNYGHNVYEILADTLPSIYILSDPDLLLNPEMPNDINSILLNLSEKHQSNKVGLSLDISDSDKFIKNGYGDLVYSIESKYYQTQIPSDKYILYKANTDTTYCLINRNYKSHENNLRISGLVGKETCFVAKHLPWYNNYLKDNVPKDELKVWIKNNKSSSILQYINIAELIESDRILFNFPSRNRPEKLLRVINTINVLSKYKNHVILLKLDLDDPTVNNEDFKSKLEKISNVKVAWGISKNKVHAINRDIVLEDCSIIITMSDDMLPVCKNFDQVIIDEMNFDGVLHHNDGHQGENILTLPIMGRKYYEKFGYIYHPDYQSLWCNNETKDVAIMLGKYLYKDKVLIDHQHPAFGYKSDDLYQRNDSFYEQDRQTYMTRKERNFDNAEIPIVIIAYNNLTFVKSFVEQCRRLTNKIIILDNNSSYMKIHEYYDNLKNVEVRRLKQNYGHKVYQTLANTLPSIYILSDADLLLHSEMPNDVIKHLIKISNRCQAGRVGLALDISDSDKFIQGNGRKAIIDEQLLYNRDVIFDEDYKLFKADIDTTFVLINYNYDQSRRIRVAGMKGTTNFTAKHLPWYDDYLKDNIPKDELESWKSNNISSTILTNSYRSDLNIDM